MPFFFVRLARLYASTSIIAARTVDEFFTGPNWGKASAPASQNRTLTEKKVPSGTVQTCKISLTGETCPGKENMLLCTVLNRPPIFNVFSLIMQKGIEEKRRVIEAHVRQRSDDTSTWTDTITDRYAADKRNAF